MAGVVSLLDTADKIIEDPEIFKTVLDEDSMGCNLETQ